MTTPVPALPAAGSTNWFAWAQGVDGAARSARPVGVYNVKDFGAKGDGATDDSAAFAAAATAAKNAARTVPFALQSDKSGSVVIEVPPGDYLITNAGAFLGDEAPTAKAVGLAWRGAGKSISNIIFKPATADAALTNDYWLGLEFHNLGFLAATAGCTFMRSYTTHNAQAYSFFNCRWWYWKYVFDLQGDNNNSEFLFVGCDSAILENAGAFLYVGTVSTSDQFLNYWFYGHKHWSTSAPLVDMSAGGHVHIYGLDASDWGGALASPGYLFNLRGFSHAYGACQLEAHGVRVEGKSVNAGLIYSEWNQGNVTFTSADFSSQVSTYTYGNTISVLYQNSGGPLYTFRDSTLAGGVKVKFGSADWQPVHRIVFDNCDWLQKVSPSDVVTYDTSGASGNTFQLPPVEFVRCRTGWVTGGIYDTTGPGAVTWDATVGYRGQPLQPGTRRELAVRGMFGAPSNASPTDILRFTLPIGALVTGLRVLSPSGAVTEADGGTWTLATTDTTPVTVATATVSGAMSAGFDVTTALAVPFECTTAAKATLTVTPTNVAQWNSRAVLLVTGYW